MTQQQQKSTALVIAAMGLFLAIAGPLIPGGERLERNSAPYTGHVTDLVGGSANSDQSQSHPLLAGTSAGEIWHYQSGLWQHLPLDFGGHPITAILGNPADDPVGTAGGLYNAPTDTRFSERVADLMQMPAGLIIGNDRGIHRLAADDTELVNAGTNVYRLITQTIDGQTYLHAGTIGAGVLSTTPDAVASDWPTNNQGLPEDAYVYSFAVTEGGKLIAGTKAGLFWQRRPGETWQPLDADHGDTRVLSLYLTPSSYKRSQHLWIGTDGQLLHANLLETTGDLDVSAPAIAVHQPTGKLPFGISGIRPTPKGVMISAGAVYQWGPVRLPGWHWLSIGGILLLILAGWMLPSRNPSAENPAS